MTIIKAKRSLSKMEFIDNAYRLQIAIDWLIARDLGLKDKVRTVTFFTKKFEPDDIEVFNNLCKKYNLTKITEEFPTCIIKQYRDVLFNQAQSLVDYITIGNSIYPSESTMIQDLLQRKSYQNLAISACYQLQQTLQRIIRASFIPIDHNQLTPLYEQLVLEEKLLKGWKKSTVQQITKAQKEKLIKDTELRVKAQQEFIDSL